MTIEQHKQTDHYMQPVLLINPTDRTFQPKFHHGLATDYMAIMTEQMIDGGDALCDHYDKYDWHACIDSNER